MMEKLVFIKNNCKKALPIVQNKWLFFENKKIFLKSLIKSIIMVFAMIGMLELCVRVRSQQETGSKQRNFLGMFFNTVISMYFKY